MRDLFDILSEEDYSRIPGRDTAIPNTDDIGDDDLPYGYCEIEDDPYEDEDEEE